MDRATKEEDDNLKKLVLDPENPEKLLSIGMDLAPEVRKELILFLTTHEMYKQRYTLNETSTLRKAESREWILTHR